MARYTDPSCRLCRREGQKLFLKGERCYSTKCSMEKRSFPPGQHGQGRKKVSEYGLQLREKQKAKRFYGLQEAQFRNTFDKASRKTGITGENLLIMLETRLDNVVFRLGFASSRKEARQLVLHGHFRVNGNRVDIPSYLVDSGDLVAVMEKSREVALIKENAEVATARKAPEWLEFNAEKIEGKVLSLPSREQIDAPVTEQLVVEFYAR